MVAGEMGVKKELAHSPPVSPPAPSPSIVLPHHLHTTTPGPKSHAYKEITDEPIDEEEFWTNMGKVSVSVGARGDIPCTSPRELRRGSGSGE